MENTRRNTLKLIAAGGMMASTACDKPEPSSKRHTGAPTPPESSPAGSDPVRQVKALPPSGPWPTEDPFLFCVHHDDRYPRANASSGPEASLSGRNIGQDFSGKDGWSMYHGQAVPGFPRHPHRGFETISVVRQGLIDHADSLGAAARYGDGDVQWLTAGNGINHAEMFPLLEQNADNPIDFFQIWLNLPAKNKRTKPHFSMFWANDVPHVDARDPHGRLTRITIVAGELGTRRALPPPPQSWAAEADNGVAVWTIHMAPHAKWTLPQTLSAYRRSLYILRGGGVRIAQRDVANRQMVTLHPSRDVPIHNGPQDSELLLLQGRPIGEPVAHHGPFVMNTPEEIREAYVDYRRTEFGGWPWPDSAPIHGHERKRFARHADGRLEGPKS
jgi:redox-sensitive bicupin YhaK (pirin superfamily)